MASTNLMMSSPHRPRANGPVSMSSSSPCLPSLDEIFLRKGPKRPPLLAEAHGAPIPAIAPTEFTSAAAILRQAPEIDIDTETITSSPPRRARTPTKGRGRIPPIANTLTNSPPSAQPPVVVGSSSPQDKPWQKFKSRTSPEHDDQPPSPTKPKCLTSKPNTNKRSTRTKEILSKHFTPKAGDLLPKNNPKGKKTKIPVEESAEEAVNAAIVTIVPAVPRRTDWTPPKANTPIALDHDSDHRELCSSVDKPSISKDVFQTLYHQYGNQDLELPPAPRPQPGVEVLRKRKRIEMVSTVQEEGSKLPQDDIQATVLPRSNEAKQSKQPKVSAPQKKTRTITELALAPFAAPIEVEGPETNESMLSYFDDDGAVKALVEHQSTVMSHRKPKAKESKKPPKTNRKRKVGTQANPVLLSPSSALKQSSNQDFIFGTSSQLMREDSPTMLRDLQAAIQASNVPGSDPFDDDVGRRLWQAGSRDEDGELLTMEVVDLQHNTIIKSNTTTTPGARSFVDIDDLLDSPQPASPLTDARPDLAQANSHFFQSQSAESSSSGKQPDQDHSAIAANSEPRPKYELFTDAQLSKQILSYGFKPVKKRAAMIALLDQCWTSKHQSTVADSVQSVSTSTRKSVPTTTESVGGAPSKAPVKRGRPKKSDDTTKRVSDPTPAAKPNLKKPRAGTKKGKANATTPAAELPIPEASPKRPRGRPKKTSNTSIEIPDSEHEDSSPLSAADAVFSSPPPVDLSMTDEGDTSLALSPTTDEQTELFKQITKAVTSAPRTKDPSKPSWHEKMLLYDPIILEEFASWLNGGELTRVGYDGEVSGVDVKKWCESKSVICLWRVSSRGKERKRL
ncbi:hypothetical protein F4808DRAFT_414488 [Astrocystis sublimbata]|nr:hypothetical protein F4808DRAFT_414488 [Astrocystis sublimbata]